MDALLAGVVASRAVTFGGGVLPIVSNRATLVACQASITWSHMIGLDRERAVGKMSTKTESQFDEAMLDIAERRLRLATPPPVS